MPNLVMRRRVRERIRIGPDILLTVVECNNYSVLFGIEAPKTIKIEKEEEIAPVADPRDAG